MNEYHCSCFDEECICDEVVENKDDLCIECAADQHIYYED